MRIVSWEEFGGLRGASETGSPLPLAAAVGVFDGLHLGHMELIKSVLSREGLVKGIVTFRENPKKELRPSTFHGDIFTLDQKLETLSILGFELCVLIDFSGEFSKLAGRKFLSLLRDRGDLRFLAVGADFRCGYQLDTGSEEIRDYYDELGVETRIIPSVSWAGKPVSSSRIRKAVLDGRLDEARAMLGRDFEVDMRSARAAIDGGLLRLEPGIEQIAPPAGRYEAALDCGGRYLSVQATKGREAWSLELPSGSESASSGPGRPRALRLIKLVSRE